MKNIDLTQEEFSVPSITQVKDFFQEKTFSKNIHSKSNKQLDVLWEKSIPKEFKENINILYTPINFNSTKRFKSLIASVKIDNQIQSYILTLIYDKISNNKQFSGHIFKHDSKGNFVEAYQYHKGNHIKTFKESKNNNKIASRSGGCTTSIFEIVALAMSGWDPGTVLDCVEVGGNNGGNGSSSSTFDDWSTPSSNIKNPIGWSLGSNNNLGSGSGGDFGDPNNGGNSNNNSNGEELNLDGVEPWWTEDEQIINELTGKAKCVYDKLKGNNNLLDKTLKKFDGTESLINLLVKEDNLDPGVSGETEYGIPIKITLDIDDMKNSPSLWGAHTIIHEAIHADIYRKVFVTGGLTYSPPNTFTLNGTSVDFPTLFDYYNNYPNNAHHNYMADYYRIAMEEGLKEYAASIGKTYPDQLYKDLAWAGLEKTNAWDNMYADPVYTANEQQRIKQAIINFKNSGNNECN